MTDWDEYRASKPLHAEVLRGYDAARAEMGIGYLLLKARASAGLTQEQLAERIGTSQPTVARWEGGKQLPSLRSLIRIAEATGFQLTLGLRGSARSEQETLTIGIG
jgi:transcriptional regulator with XRE-family HTH domain